MKVAAKYAYEMGSLPAFNNEWVDSAAIAEAAEDRSHAWYETIVAVRQSMLNLLASGLFHLAEQQLANLCHDASFLVIPPGDTKLGIVSAWYRNHFGLKLETLQSWAAIDELRFVANAVKHAEGSSTEQLLSFA